MNYFYLTRQEIEELPDDEFPLKMGTYKKKKKESLAAWRIILLRLIDDGSIKLRVRKKKAEAKDKIGELLLVIGDEAIGLFRDQKMLGPEEGYRAAYLAATPDESDRTSRAAKLWSSTEPSYSESYAELCYDMYRWVEATLDLKQEEAECNLDCFSCERHKLLGCSITNAAPARDDGHPLSLGVPHDRS